MALILAQAGIFILRVLFVTTSLPVNRDNLVDQLRQVITLYINGELSETQSSTHYVRTFVDICRMAGVDLDPTMSVCIRVMLWLMIRSQSLQTDLDTASFSFDWLANQAPVDQPDSATDFNRLFGLPIIPDWADSSQVNGNGCISVDRA
jgi:hypothetical protein